MRPAGVFLSIQLSNFRKFLFAAKPAAARPGFVQWMGKKRGINARIAKTIGIMGKCKQKMVDMDVVL